MNQHALIKNMFYYTFENGYFLKNYILKIYNLPLKS